MVSVAALGNTRGVPGWGMVRYEAEGGEDGEFLFVGVCCVVINHVPCSAFRKC